MGEGLAVLRSRRVRGLVAQGLALLVLLLFAGAFLNWLLSEGLIQRFGFLNDVAGYDIIQKLIPYTEASSHGRALVVGLLNTLLVATIGIVLATVLGFAVGIGSVSGNWLIARMSESFVEIVRNVPVLLQLFFWYFAALRAVPGPRESWSLFEAVFLNTRGLYVPSIDFGGQFWLVLLAALLGLVAWIALSRFAHARKMRTGQDFPGFSLGLAMFLLLSLGMIAALPKTVSVPELAGLNFQGGMTILPELIALILALSVYTAAYIAENVRAGIEGVPKGQTEAAQALGLSRGQMLRLVIVPQAMRIIIPPLTSQYLNLTKNSSLAIAIAYPDLVAVFAGTTLSQTGREIEIILMTMGIYLTLSLLTSLIMNGYNARIALKGGR